MEFNSLGLGPVACMRLPVPPKTPCGYQVFPTQRYGSSPAEPQDDDVSYLCVESHSMANQVAQVRAAERQESRSACLRINSGLASTYIVHQSPKTNAHCKDAQHVC